MAGWLDEGSEGKILPWLLCKPHQVLIVTCFPFRTKDHNYFASCVFCFLSVPFIEVRHVGMFWGSHFKEEGASLGDPVSGSGDPASLKPWVQEPSARRGFFSVQHWQSSLVLVHELWTARKAENRRWQMPKVPILWMVAKSISAPPKKPENEDSPINTNQQWFPMVSKWCRILSIHSINCVCLCQ